MSLICFRTSMAIVFYHNFLTLDTNFSLNQVNLQKFKELVLYEILDLEGNTARTPSAYTHVLE